MNSDRIERIRERLLMCPICIDEYKDPRMLPCHHSVCLTCLVDYVRISTCTGRMFRCPQCRTDVFVPRGGLEDLPSNFYVTSIMDEIGSKQYSSVCDVCEREWLRSQFRCVDCDIDICRFCIHKHKLFEHDGSKEWNIIKIESGSSTSCLTSAKNCPVHTEETLQLFCNSCSEPVCITCSCEAHKKHDTEPLQRKLLASQKWLQEEFDSLTSKLKDVKAVEAEVTKLLDRLETATDKAVSEIKERGEILKKQLEELVDSRVKSVLEEMEKGVQKYEEYYLSLSKCDSDMRKGVAFLEDLQDGDMTLEVLDCFEQYKSSLLFSKENIVNKVIEVKEPKLSIRNEDIGSDNRQSLLGTLQFDHVSNTFFGDGSSDKNDYSLKKPLQTTCIQFVYPIIAAVIIITLISTLRNMGYGQYGVIQSSTDYYELAVTSVRSLFSNVQSFTFYSNGSYW